MTCKPESNNTSVRPTGEAMVEVFFLLRGGDGYFQMGSFQKKKTKGACVFLNFGVVITNHGEERLVWCVCIIGGGNVCCGRKKVW